MENQGFDCSWATQEYKSKMIKSTCFKQNNILSSFTTSPWERIHSLFDIKVAKMVKSKPCASHCKWVIFANFSYCLSIFEHATVFMRLSRWIFIIHFCNSVKIWESYMLVKAYQWHFFFLHVTGCISPMKVWRRWGRVGHTRAMGALPSSLSFFCFCFFLLDLRPVY